MKRLLIVAGIAITLCLDLVAAQAEIAPLTPAGQYSRPVAGALIAQAVPPTINGECQLRCANANANCQQNPPPGPSCSQRQKECVDRCP